MPYVRNLPYFLYIPFTFYCVFVSETGSDLDEMNNSKFKDSGRPRDESPESKKNRKKAVKEAQAEKRKQKLKKHVKKRKEKLGTKK